MILSEQNVTAHMPLPSAISAFEKMLEISSMVTYTVSVPLHHLHA